MTLFMNHSHDVENLWVWDAGAKFHSSLKGRWKYALVVYMMSRDKYLSHSHWHDVGSKWGSHGQSASVQVVVVSDAAVHSDWWNVNLLCETWPPLSQWSLQLWLVAVAGEKLRTAVEISRQHAALLWARLLFGWIFTRQRPAHQSAPSPRGIPVGRLQYG